ncbi:MAG: amino-acid N-acetyltransferase [Campylobacterota bacterium]|nr:amino-acid N-acetyltransferase [Campylobacterota bacterium]
MKNYEIVLEKPTLNDISNMQNLVKDYVKEGIILARSDDEVANAIRSYIVAKIDGKIVGFASLYIYSKDLAEIRTLVADKNFQRVGVGKRIVSYLLDEGKKLGVKKVLVLVYDKGFFLKQGFQEVSKEEIPEHKVWEDCIRCKLFPVCNESALIINL